MKAFLIKYCSLKHRSYYYKVNSETKDHQTTAVSTEHTVIEFTSKVNVKTVHKIQYLPLVVVWHTWAKYLRQHLETSVQIRRDIVSIWTARAWSQIQNLYYKTTKLETWEQSYLNWRSHIVSALQILTLKTCLLPSIFCSLPGRRTLMKTKQPTPSGNLFKEVATRLWLQARELGSGNLFFLPFLLCRRRLSISALLLDSVSFLQVRTHSQ